MPPTRRSPEKSKSPDQQTTVLHIKNMVCNRCIKVVVEELEKLLLDVRSITLGEVIVAGDVSSAQHENVRRVLAANGFELIEDKKVRTIERIKLAILKLIRSGELEKGFEGKYSEYLAKEIGQEYSSLSGLFSSRESITIEHYIILQKIERAKELLKYHELTLSEISYKLGYSSVAHLSGQFKKITGMTPTRFKKIMQNTRLPLDKIYAIPA